ncbi:MAG: RNA polymerase sigma factor [Eudoraea sp.]|nr:RNA polymerase sigma factor [Eudoraea sp.]
MGADKTYVNLSDLELVEQIVLQNNPLLFELLYDRYAKIVYNKCYGFSKSADEAQDLTQDVFLHLYLKLPTFKGTSKFSTWLYALTYNFCTNYVNRDKGRKIKEKVVHNSDLEYDKLSFAVSDESIFQMRSDRLKKALELIPAEDRSILLLKYQDEVPIKELVTILDIGESAVKMRLKRAKQKVLETYKKLP